MVVLSLFVVWCFSFCFVSFFFFFCTRTSRLGPMARTLLGGLEHAIFKFFVVAARLFLVFCVCLNFDDLAKQRRKIFGGVSEVGKNDFSVYFCRPCVFFLVFFFSAAIARDLLSSFDTNRCMQVLVIVSLIHRWYEWRRTSMP